MGRYVYKAVGRDGNHVTGMIEAADQADALARLEKTGCTPLEMREESRTVRGKVLRSGFVRVKSEEMMVFYIQLSNMVAAGINILSSLESIEAQLTNKKLKYVLQSIAAEIEEGSSLSEALSKHKDVFPELFVNMVKSGEASGKLDIVLQSYASLYEEQVDLNQKISGALFYPLILFCLGSVVILFLVTFIIPQFVRIFAEAGISLPAPTKMLYLLSMAIKRYWYVLALLGGVGVYGALRYLRTGPGKYQLDNLMLRLPIAGRLNHNVALTRFATTLGMLLKSGVPIIRSLELTAEVVQNSVLARSILGVARAIEKGENLSRPLGASGWFPATFVQMTAVGEDTGDLDGMLEKAGVFYAKAVSNTIKKITVVLEPVFLIALGSVVGFIMASIILPLFKMVAVVKI